MDVVAATLSYESWLGGLVSLHQPDLDYKHARMADPDDPFPFFRGTYYLWARHWSESADSLADAPTVLAVGDLHLENFGTWRDADGRLCWGVNDFDEADRLPYTIDLVRLAASARFARKAGRLPLKTTRTCAALLEGYRTTLAVGGCPHVLEERHPRLRAMAMNAERDPARFWRRMTAVLADPEADPPPEVRTALVRELPADAPAPQFRFRPRAGMGSLGKPRYLALAEWRGGWVAREAKAITPPATAWAWGRAGGSLLAEAVRGAVRSADPLYRPGPGWVLRRLAPRCSRIDLDHLHHVGDLYRLLRAMGAETANIHLGTPGAAPAIEADLARRPDGWLAGAARLLGRLIEKDWAAWRKTSTRLR